jgi:hypothetical protein
MLLNEDETGVRRHTHTNMALDPPIFAVLATAVPFLHALRCDAKTVTLPEEMHSSTIQVAVIGAGAGTVPSSLVARYKDTQVVAVDIDAGASGIGSHHNRARHQISSMILFYSCVTCISTSSYAKCL